MITKLQLCLLSAGAWLGMQACMFVHDDACAKDSDCKNGRICNAGTCSDTDGSVSPEGSDVGNEGSASGNGGGTPAKGPTCTALRSGMQQATHAETALCQAPTSSFSVSIGSSGLVQSIDGRSCTLTKPGYSCYETSPDEYQCGACTFKVNGVSTTGTGPPVGWTVSVAGCSEACTQYCCSSDSAIIHTSDYWLDQTGSGGGTTPGGSNSGSNPRDPCDGCGFPFCDGNCVGCC
jgi:hypothetical protein